MGINGLWDVLGQGEIVHVAEYARRFYEEKGRPLRVAVDEACWRYNNLTPEQVDFIRNSSENAAAAHPVEKTILWRTLRLLKLNIQLIFVTDGPGKPGKDRNHGKGQLVKYDIVKVLHQLFTRLGVPYHSAPGEAEAECARLQELGIVDVVWSDDGDALMFGARLLMRQHKDANNKPVDGYVRIYSMDRIEREHDLDRQSLVVFTLLCGGDYSVAGLKGVGHKAARVIAQRKYGLGPKTQTVTQAELPQWRDDVRKAMFEAKKQALVPEDFPKFKALEAYRNPNISKDWQLHNMSGLKHGWAKPIDLAKLRIELRQRYNFDTKQYLKHMAPIMLVRSLDTAPKEENLRFGITLKRQNKPGQEVKITFKPHSLFPFDLLMRPPEEDWTKTKTPYDPSQDVECEILQCLLDHGLPEGSLESAKPALRKRKAQSEEEGCSPVTKRTKNDRSGSVDDSAPTKKPKRVLAEKDRNLQPHADASIARVKEGETKTAQANMVAERSQPASGTTYRPPQFQHLELFDFGDFGVMDLTDPDESSLNIPKDHLKPSPRPAPTSKPQPPTSPAVVLDEPVASMQPGKATDPAVLRALRQAALPAIRSGHSMMKARPESSTVGAQACLEKAERKRMMPWMGKTKASAIEIIDLT